MQFVKYLLIWEVVMALKRKFTRRQTFKAARDRAAATKKKLLVIGDPDNGFFNSITGKDYEYGDVCIDLTGCPNAPKDAVVYKDVVQALPEVNLDEYVIFESCVFEYIDDMEKVKKTLQRVAPENLFCVQVEPYSLAAYIYPGFLMGDDSIPKRIFTAYPPFDAKVDWFANPFMEWNKTVLFCMLLAAFCF